jgi:hypothetical protein
MNTTTDSVGAVVSSGDYIAYATTEFRSVEQKIYRVTYVYDNGVCDCYDPRNGKAAQIGCINTQGIKLSNYVPK